jgi:ferredoxin
MGSIDADDPSGITGKCTKCCACVKYCPVEAKYFDDPGYLWHKQELEEKYTVPARMPEYYL